MTIELPIAADAEAQVLAGLILDNRRAPEIRALVSDRDFHDEFNGELFRACCALLDAGSPVDLVTLRERFPAERLTGAVQRIASIMESAVNASNAAGHAGIVADYAHRRRLIEAARAVALAASNAFDSKGVERAQSAALAMLESRSARGALRAVEFSDDVRREVDEAHRRTVDEGYVRTGLHDLDRVLGGLRPGSVTVLAARPSQGKSSFATTMLMRMCVEKSMPAALFTVEVARNDALRNIACCLAKTSGHALMNHQAPDADYVTFDEALGRVEAAPLYVDDSPGLTSMAVRAGLRRLVSTRGIRFAIVDYLQILSAEATTERGATREREVARMSSNLKAAAREAGVPLIVLAQLNREIEHRDNAIPRLSDLRESGSIEADADIVLFLSQPKARGDGGEPADDPSRGVLKHIDVAKNRNGPVKQGIGVYLFRSWTRFESVSTVAVQEWNLDMQSTNGTKPSGNGRRYGSE